MMQQKHFHSLFISCLFLLSMTYLSMLLHYCNMGIDLTDEGFYLNWIATPFNYTVSHTQFGYIYHPLYQLLGENLVRLRQVDLLILWGLTSGVCHALLQFLFKNNMNFSPPLLRYMLSFAMGTMIFSFFGAWWWIPTPSYNSLALEALLITTLGFISISAHPQKILGWSILSTGWWLAFMAKPTTALALGLYTTLLLLPTLRVTWKKYLLSVAITLGLLYLSALLIDGGLTTFILRLYHGVHMMTLLYGGSPFELVSDINFLHDKLLILVFLGIAGASFLIVSTSSPLHLRVQFVLFGLLSYATWAIIQRHWMLPPLLAPSVNLLLFAVPIGASLAFLLIRRNPHEAAMQDVSIWQLMTLFLFLISLPYIFSIGTRGNVWTTAMRTSVFWILAALPLLKRKDVQSFSAMQAILGLTFCALFVTTLLTQYSMSFPYRQSQSLFEQTEVFEIENQQGKITSRLIVSNQDKQYLEEMKKSARQHGFHHGDHMIDLTGAFPSVPYLLGANPIDAAWNIAGFIGSTEFTIASLAETPCHQLTRAWLLTSLNGIEKYDPRILIPYGLSADKYDVITEVIPAHSGLLHQYWKPKTSTVSLTHCEAQRAEIKKKQQILRTLVHNAAPIAPHIFEQAQEYIKQKTPQKAISLLKNATFINPSNPVLFNNLCIFYGIQKEYKLGIQACKTALAIDPRFELAQNNLAWLMQVVENQ